ncbi:MAG TPA: response regulator transcription factor [Chthonomonadaceae bacterium]|nr:response regulator transcription factor [Chthonomonadaceae bacterium]
MKKVSVMLVDDHAIWRDGVKSMLEDTEFTVVVEASSGKEAIEVACQAKPQMTLLDIRMSNGDGLEALVALKEEHPRIAVVMLTTYENPTYMARAVAGGAVGVCEYLLKPVTSEYLVARLEQVYREWQKASVIELM